MEYRFLGNTGISVSRMCLGTMMMGAFGNSDHGECITMIQTALDTGINFIDTADVYSAGESEQIVGKAIRGRRDKVVVATKFSMPTGEDRNTRGASRRWIVKAVEASPRRLGTDRIDLLISVVLLTGGTVAVFAYRMANFDWGIDTTDLYMMQVQLPAETYATPAARVSFYERVLAEVRGQRGIEAAKITRDLGRTRFAVDDYERYGDYPMAQLVAMSETPSELVTTLLAGRNFDSRDSATGARTAIVSEALAKIYWPGQSALGRVIAIMGEDGTADERTVVGVVRDIRYDPTTANDASLAAIYAPLPQLTASRFQVAVRHRGGESEVREALYEALGNVDAAVPAGRLMGYRTVLGQLTIFATTLTNLFIGCGAFAILLAMTGIYGLSSNAVVQRTHEIGLRRAMGASNRSIIALFLAQGGRQLAIGLSISALLSIGTLFLLSQMADVAAPVVAVMGIAVVLVVSGLVLTSIYVSVRGAIRREPSAALRHG